MRPSLKRKVLKKKLLKRKLLGPILVCLVLALRCAAINTSPSNLGSGFVASNICIDATIYGLAGSASCISTSNLLASNAWRDAGTVPAAYIAGRSTSKQLLQSEETGTYGQAVGGASLPTSGGYSYRDVPNDTLDDEGYTGNSVKYALRPMVACGSSGSIATRIEDCASKNSTRASWSGADNGHSGEASWKLVYATGQTVANSCTGAATDCKEVWQDQRTGLIWSSLANAGAVTNWCKAAGVIALAPLVLRYAYGNSTLGTPLVGSGTISKISGGSSSSANATITVSFSSSTSFSVTGDVGGCNGTGTIEATAGATVTYTQSGYCTFTLTQGSALGSMPFQTGDTFILGNSQASTVSCVPGASSGYQPSITSTTGPISYCAELSGFYPGFTSGAWGTGDSWGSAGGWASGQSYTYDQAKGGMGANSTYPVRWRLPTIHDYRQADVDGIRFVLPDAGAPNIRRANPDGSPGSSGGEVTATLVSTLTGRPHSIDTIDGSGQTLSRLNTYRVRCVGR